MLEAVKERGGPMFNHEKIVGFEYVKKKGHWYLSTQIIDPEVAAEIGREVFNELPAISGLFPPQYAHLRRLVLALAKHGLDGGGIREIARKTKYRAEVIVRPRPKKAEHKSTSP